MSLLGRLAWVTPTSLLSWPIPCSVAKEAAFTRYAIEVYNNKLIYIYLQAGRANIAKCVASLVSHSAREAVVVVQQFMASLSATQQDYSLTFSLLAIGEIGRGADLSSLQDLKPAVLGAFGHNSEEVKSAASYALGNLALGNLSEYLPFILHEIETQPRRQYLLLHSLKEVISAVSTGELRHITKN